MPNFCQSGCKILLPLLQFIQTGIYSNNTVMSVTEPHLTPTDYEEFPLFQYGPLQSWWQTVQTLIRVLLRSSLMFAQTELFKYKG